jgi:hypothetical protein
MVEEPYFPPLLHFLYQIIILSISVQFLSVIRMIGKISSGTHNSGGVDWTCAGRF